MFAFVFANIVFNFQKHKFSVFSKKKTYKQSTNCISMNSKRFYTFTKTKYT